MLVSCSLYFFFLDNQELLYICFKTKIYTYTCYLCTYSFPNTNDSLSESVTTAALFHYHIFILRLYLMIDYGDLMAIWCTIFRKLNTQFCWLGLQLYHDQLSYSNRFFFPNIVIESAASLMFIVYFFLLLNTINFCYNLQLEALYPEVYKNVHEYGNRYCKGVSSNLYFSLKSLLIFNW